MFSPFQAYQDEGYSEDPLTNRAISSENAVPGWIQNLPEQERARTYAPKCNPSTMRIYESSFIY